MKPTKGERAVQILLALLKSSCYLALFLGMQVLVMMPIIIAAVIQTVAEDGMLDENWLYAVLNEHAMTFSLIANLFTLLFLLAFYLIRRKKLGETLWLRRVDGPTLWEGAALAPGLFLITNFAVAALPESWLESYNEASAGITSGGVVGAIAVVLAAPVVEEFIFRGLIMTRLSRAMPGWLAVLLSAAIFGACHSHPVWFSYTFVLGIVLGFMDMRADSIWPSILGHAAFNSFSQIFTILPESDIAELAAVGVLLVAAIVAPILDRKAIVDLFRSRPEVIPVQELPATPGVYDFDPWDT